MSWLPRHPHYYQGEPVGVHHFSDQGGTFVPKFILSTLTICCGTLGIHFVTEPYCSECDVILEKTQHILSKDVFQEFIELLFLTLSSQYTLGNKAGDGTLSLHRHFLNDREIYEGRNPNVCTSSSDSIHRAHVLWQDVGTISV